MTIALREAYSSRYETTLVRMTQSIDLHLREHLSSTSRIDRISVRAKTIDSFLKKAENRTDRGDLKYSEPLEQIQDQIGARVITFYKSDVSIVNEVINKYYRAIEDKTRVPEREWEFGYFGHHYVLHFPRDIIPDDVDSDLVPRFFELQIKTLFQHAWSEAEHDLGYKTGGYQLHPDDMRRLAFTSAQAGARIKFSMSFFGNWTPPGQGTRTPDPTDFLRAHMYDNVLYPM